MAWNWIWINATSMGRVLPWGHPVGCTALRIVVSLYYQMEKMGATLGGASLCVGGRSSHVLTVDAEIYKCCL
ncbi:MAG: hypothetical protein ACOX0F_03290 [Syntrophomonadaceae bacterium]